MNIRSKINVLVFIDNSKRLRKKYINARARARARERERQRETERDRQTDRDIESVGWLVCIDCCPTL